jgi:hypothetical protein
MTTTPRRIQRRRTKGWRKPDGAVYVGRGTRWGNPNQIAPVDFGGWNVNHDNGSSVGVFGSKRDAHLFAVEAYRAHLEDNPKLADRARRELAGRDLMCWCPPELPCHADVLLELANSQPAAA